MKKYSHAFDIAFSIETYKEPHEITEQELFEALKKRIRNLESSPGEILEAVDCWDTMEIEDNS